MNQKRDIVMNAIELYLKILSNKYTEEVTDIQMPVLVHEMTMHAKHAILVEAAAAISKNDILRHKRETEAKLNQFISNRYKDLVLNLGLFKWRGTALSEAVEMKYKESIIEGVIEIVVADRRTEKEFHESYRRLGSFMNQKFDAFQSSILSRAYNN